MFKERLIFVSFFFKYLFKFLYRLFVYDRQLHDPVSIEINTRKRTELNDNNNNLPNNSSNIKEDNINYKKIH